MEMERRFLATEMRASEADENIIEGYAVVYEMETDLGWFRESIARGAATEALKMSDEFVLFNHNSDLPLARRKNGTLTVTEDDKGLFIRADVSKSSEGPNVYKNVKNGLIDKMSFAFTVDEETWTEKTDEKDLRTINKFRELYDYSPVTYPAYKQTELVARSAEKIAEEHKPTLVEPEPSTEEDRSYLEELDVYEREINLIEGEI